MRGVELYSCAKGSCNIRTQHSSQSGLISFAGQCPKVKEREIRSDLGRSDQIRPLSNKIRVDMDLFRHFIFRRVALSGGVWIRRAGKENP